VKCDEQKPSCHSCKSTGRRCDWTHPLMLPSTREMASVSLAIKQLPGSIKEIGHFQFFSTQTTPQLSGLFGYTLWNQEVLHACVSHPAIWHAAVAVASLQRERGSPVAKKIVDEDTPSGFTLQQYAMAMRLMRESILGCQPPAVDTALICCLLFICFEVSCIIAITSGADAMNSLFAVTMLKQSFISTSVYDCCPKSGRNFRRMYLAQDLRPFPGPHSP